MRYKIGDKVRVITDELKEIQNTKQNVTLEYEGVWQYPIGVCPGTDWMVTGVSY